MSQAIRDYRSGKPLSDEQLAVAVKHLRPLVTASMVLDDRLAFMARELNLILMQFDDFIEVRKKKCYMEGQFHG